MPKIVVSLLVACMTFVARDALAASPSAAILGGIGRFLIGAGGRAGVTLDTSVYLGGTFIYHVGESRSNRSFWYTGAEFGYDAPAGPLKVRPYLGMGYANVTPVCPDGYCTPAEPKSPHDAMIWPGVTLLVPIAVLFVGLDARYNLLIGSGYDTVSVFATAGFAFSTERSDQQRPPSTQAW